MSNTPTGISGIAVHVPPFRVDLQQWCNWSGQDWNKIRDVVGTGFRLPGNQQSVYTMAANAVLQLIEKYDVDPAEVHFLGLGTESSTDNSAGAVIARGMVDDALRQLGKAPLSRNCEVPEFKHACLGGVYALKNAVRFLQTDGKGSKAIVVCSDIALYKPGSSGEPTQGSGAVALLLEENPTIATLDLSESGNASNYRIVDFRKPIQYTNGDGKTHASSNVPVFNGRYSASCYVDELLSALDNMFERRAIEACDYFRDVAAVFMHRPFKRMPENGWGMAYLFNLAVAGGAGVDELQGYASAAGVGMPELMQEMTERPNPNAFGCRDKIREEVFPLTARVLRAFRKDPAYRERVLEKMRLGSAAMEELGNLYTGALPAWLAAGLEQAAAESVDLDHKELLLFGYGSGDAAEALPIKIVPGWEAAVQKIDMQAVMSEAIDLDEEQYRLLRQGSSAAVTYQPSAEFVIDRIGGENEEAFQDKGIEYYRFIN
jgi:hydroxymethylglutaryl-CoA synthase